MLLINGLLHWILNTPYLFSRTALVLYPVLITGLFGLLDKGSGRKGWRNMLAGGFLLVLLYNLYKNFSLKTFVEWPVQTHTEYTLDYLQKNGAKKRWTEPFGLFTFGQLLFKSIPGPLHV
jgi:hypothetical protein